MKGGLICLLDHDLKTESLGSHSWTVAHAFLESPEPVEVWAHQSCDLGDRRIRKIFRVSAGSLHKMRRAKTVVGLWVRHLVALVYCNLSYLICLLRQYPSPGDVLFAINASPFIVIGIQLHALVRKRVQHVLYFQHACSRSNKVAGRIHLFLRLKNVHYAAETPDMVESYGRALRLPCHHVRLPVPARVSVGAMPPLPFRALAPGQPRREKGFDILVSALKLMADDLASGRLEIAVQVSDLEAELKREFEELIKLAHEFPAIRLIPDSLPEELYAQLFGGSHFLVLPYRRNAYSLRGSGIATEALLAGKPVVVTEGLTFSGALATEAVAVLARDGDPRDFAEAIRALMQNFETLKATACGVARRYQSMHSIRAVREQILTICGDAALSS